MIWWATFLFLAAIVLIFAEFFLPGGVCGAMAMMLFFASCVAAVYAFPDHWPFIVLGELVSLAVCIAIGLTILSRTNAAKALRLDASQRVEDGYVNQPSDTSLIGATGLVLTALRPAGTVSVNGRRIDAVSSSEFIEKDTNIRVIEVHGNRIVVEEMVSF